MGTNYFCCRNFKKKIPKSAIHIGKKSYGWSFSFRAHEACGLVTSSAWLNFLYTNPQLTIVDEYNNPISYGQFKDLVNSSLLEPNNQYLWSLKRDYLNTREETDWLDDSGFCITSVDFS